MNVVRLKPRPIAVAGPNGEGKTSTTEQLLRHEWMGDSAYVNPAINAKCLRLRIMKGGYHEISRICTQHAGGHAKQV